MAFVSEGCIIGDSLEQAERIGRLLAEQKRRRNYLRRFIHLVDREPRDDEWNLSEKEMTALFKREHRILGGVGSLFLKLIRPFRYEE